jgi:hypothetical protein
VHLLWSQTVPAPLHGLTLARERDGVLAWDGQDSLFLFNHAGTIQARAPSPTPIAVACGADDGSAYAMGGAQAPVVCWLAPDLAPRWQRSLPQRATAIALEPLGQYVAVADAGGALHLFDRRGHRVWQATTPRPLWHLAFVPEKPILVGAADFGLVLCFGASGECLWRDGLVAHVGALAVSGDGSSILLACFGDGLYRYNVAGPQPQRIPLDGACHLAALSYAGDCLLTAERDHRVRMRAADGTLRDQAGLDGPAIALALGPLGNYGIVGLANGTLLRFDIRSNESPC